MRTFRFFICFFLILVVTGCGYAFQGGGSILPPDVRKIYIPLVENSSTTPGLSTVVTDSLRDYFERYGVITVVDNITDADAVLTGKITKIRRETSTVSSNTDTALQLSTVLSMSAELRRVNGGLLWSNENVSVAKAFGTSQDVVVTTSADFAGGNLGAGALSALDSREIGRGQEQEAFEQMADLISRRIYLDAVAPDF